MTRVPSLWAPDGLGRSDEARGYARTLHTSSASMSEGAWRELNER